MAEHGFTPGKWEQTNDSSWSAENPQEEDGICWTVIRAESGEDVAIVMEATPDWRHAHMLDANARLIAASPTLLEALIQAVEEIEDLRKHANNHGAMIDNERCDYARAAITLATGKDA